MSGKLHRKARQNGHNHLPNFIGKQFPRAEEGNYRASEYHASCMLLLLKPWRKVGELRGENETWMDTYREFKATTPKNVVSFIANVQHFHRCKDAADQAGEGQNAAEERQENNDDEYEIRDENAVAADQMPTVQEWQQLEISKVPIPAHNQARFAVFQGERCQFFTDRIFEHEASARVAEGDDYRKIDEWMTVMAAQRDESRNATNESGRAEEEGTVMRIDGSAATATVQYMDEPGQALEPIDLEALNQKQRQVYDIVRWVKDERDSGRNPPQLLMIVHGEGGTGKSRVIQTINEIYKRSDDGKKLAKIAYTGIAASIIEGEPIHHAIRLRPNTSNHVSDNIREDLQAKWGNKQLLIIDEISGVG
jgi:hypothetical protein